MMSSRAAARAEAEQRLRGLVRRYRRRTHFSKPTMGWSAASVSPGVA